MDETCCQYKDVVIIGNGPSAITLSYMLAGHWPYYVGDGHPIEYLHSKLDANRSKSLVEQDLVYLSEGLEGRSQNPVSVLLDALTHPEADLGVSNPSSLTWKLEEDRLVDHVVIGNGLPGGTWQQMEGSTLTISPGNWMELPDSSFSEWNSTRNKESTTGMKQKRAVVGSVASYYQDYVNTNGLDRFFLSDALVMSVTESTTPKPTEATLWKVEGIHRESNSSFCYVTPHVVLATGVHNLPNRLCVRGEEDFPFVMHSLPSLETAANANDISKLLIVGAGLSAADAIITAGFYNVPVIHAFRCDVSDQRLIFNQLPENMYPEYHRVHRMMKTGGAGYYQDYKVMSQHRIKEIMADGTVILQRTDTDDDDISVVKVSHVCILIGSRPDLSFFPEDGNLLGLEYGRLIDSKNNPVDVNTFTHESYRYPGIFAVGPLVGDNFVRFVQGGALAITNHLHSKREMILE